MDVFSQAIVTLLYTVITPPAKRSIYYTVGLYVDYAFLILKPNPLKYTYFRGHTPPKRKLILQHQN